MRARFELRLDGLGCAVADFKAVNVSPRGDAVISQGLKQQGPLYAVAGVADEYVAHVAASASGKSPVVEMVAGVSPAGVVMYALSSKEPLSAGTASSSIGWS